MCKHENSDEHYASGQLMKISIFHRMAICRRMEGDELHFGQFPILKTILANPECTQAFLAERLKVTQASVALSTKRLQKNGLIDKTQDEDNLRKNKLRITEKGEEVFEKHRKIQDEVNSLTFSGIGKDEMASFKKTLDKIIINLSEGMDPGMKWSEIIALDKQTKNKNSRKDTV